MSPKLTHHAAIPYVEMIEEDLQHSLSTIEECFEWLNEILEACKNSFAKPDIQLLPETPHTKKGRRKRVLTHHNYKKSDSQISSVDSDKESTPSKVPRQTRTRRIKQTSPPNEPRVTRNTRSKLNFSLSSSSQSSQSSSSPDARVKSSVSKPVYHVVFSPQPVSPNSIVKQRASAYEAMLQKKKSPSPVKQVRKHATSETPEFRSLPDTPVNKETPKMPALQDTPMNKDTQEMSTLQDTPMNKDIQEVSTLQDTPVNKETQEVSTFQDTPVNKETQEMSSLPDTPVNKETPEIDSFTDTPETLKPLKVVSKMNFPSAKCDETTPVAKGEEKLDPRSVDEKEMTPSRRVSSTRSLRSTENHRRSSRKSLKATTKQLRKLSGRQRRSRRSNLLESFTEPIHVEPMQCDESTKRPRTRLRLKKIINNNAAVSGSPREENITASSESTSGQDHDHDDKENKETKAEVQLQPPVKHSTMYKQAVVHAVESDGDEEVFRMPRSKLRVKKVKKTKLAGSGSDFPRTSCSDTDSSSERSVRQSTRTKTRKRKTVQNKSSVSESSECEKPVVQKCDSNSAEGRTLDKDNGAQRESVDSGIGSKGIGAVNVDNKIEKESMRRKSSRSSGKMTDSENNNKTEPEPEPEKTTRTKTRKRQAEDEVKSAPPKRSCTGSMTSFSKEEQIDNRRNSEHNTSQSASDSGNSDGDSSDKTPSPKCPRDKIVLPHTFSFMSHSKYNTPKPSNLLSGMVTSFIKRSVNTPTHISQQDLMEMRRKEFKEKQKKEQDRIRKREEQLRKKMEERKRKREERMRKVAEHREMKERIEREMKEQTAKKTVERLQTTDKLKEEKLKEEKELKARIRLKKQQEAEIRRKQDAEEKMRKRQEMEEELRRHHDMMQRKKEFEEQERQKKIAEERKKYDRVAEIERERMMEQEKQRKMQEDEMRERQKQKEEKEKAYARERAEKEKQELERRREREIALKKEMEILKEMEKKRMQRLHQEELKAEELRKQDQKLKMMIEKHNNEVITKGAMPSALINIKLNSTVTLDSTTASNIQKELSILTNEKTKGSCGENYNIDDLRSDDSSDDDEAPKKKIPSWAQGQMLKAALIQQHYSPPDLDLLFQKIEPPDLNDIFVKQKPRFNKRGSSAIWDSPLLK